jgi:hypothetical protein
MAIFIPELYIPSNFVCKYCEPGTLRTMPPGTQTLISGFQGRKAQGRIGQGRQAIVPLGGLPYNVSHHIIVGQIA